KRDLPIETEKDLKLIDEKKTVKQGTEAGWCGFPAIAPNELCFFAGHISCFLKKEESYLIDGVAINGVSGGPAFYIAIPGEKLKVCGVISAYLANRATGETLPGVSVVRSVKQYHETLKTLKSLGEAEKNVEEEKKQQKESASEIPQKSKSKQKEKVIRKEKF
ncbi:unnamed protein product, partial [marine sediment metagenome]